MQLEPGQTERVSLEVPAQELAYYDEDASTWVVEPGAYEATVARHSKDAEAPRVGSWITPSTPRPRPRLYCDVDLRRNTVIVLP